MQIKYKTGWKYNYVYHLKLDVLFTKKKDFLT